MRSCSQKRSTCRHPPGARMGEWAHRPSGDMPFVPSSGTPSDLLRRTIRGSERVHRFFDARRRTKYEQCMRQIVVRRIGEHRISPDAPPAGMCMNSMEQTPLADDSPGGVFMPMPLFMVPHDANLEPLSTGIGEPVPSHPHHVHSDRQVPPSSATCSGSALASCSAGPQRR